MKRLRDFGWPLAAALLCGVGQLPCAAQTPAARPHGTAQEGKTTMIEGDKAAAWIASPNFNVRVPSGIPVDVLVLHSTCMPTNETMETVRHFENPASQVSSHYVVGKDGQVVQMVSEGDRAWHAGVCRWQGRTDINSCSIGIEMVHRDQDPNDDWPPAQVEAVARLLLDIRSRHRIPNDHVVFHSEIAYPPGRKTDPVGFDRSSLLQRVALLAVASEQPSH